VRAIAIQNTSPARGQS